VFAFNRSALRAPCRVGRRRSAPHREARIAAAARRPFSAVEHRSAVRRAHFPDLLAKKSRSTVSCPILACTAPCGSWQLIVATNMVGASADPPHDHERPDYFRRRRPNPIRASARVRHPWGARGVLDRRCARRKREMSRRPAGYGDGGLREARWLPLSLAQATPLTRPGPPWPASPDTDVAGRRWRNIARWREKNTASQTTQHFNRRICRSPALRMALVTPPKRPATANFGFSRPFRMTVIVIRSRAKSQIVFGAYVRRRNNRVRSGPDPAQPGGNPASPVSFRFFRSTKSRKVRALKRKDPRAGRMRAIDFCRCPRPLSRTVVAARFFPDGSLPRARRCRSKRVTTSQRFFNHLRMLTETSR
jgi:hypothetical protein